MLDCSASGPGRPATVQRLEQRMLFTTAALLADLTPGAGSTNPYGIAAGSPRSFFSVPYVADSGTADGGLWVTDGTAAGTTNVFSAVDPTFGNPEELLGVVTSQVLIGDDLLFIATDRLGGVSLWRTDGTAAGTVRLSPASVGVYFDLLVGDGAGGAYFVATEPSNSFGYVVWHTDGTTAGTAAVGSDEIPVQNFKGGLPGANPTGAVVGGRFVYASNTTLYALDPSTGDGTAIFTSPHGEDPIADLSSFGGEAIFDTTGSGLSNRPGALYATDGTSAGTVMLIDGVEGGATATFAANPSPDPGAAGDLFSYDGGLWRTDGTAAGTSQVFSNSSGVYNLAQFAGRSYFIALDTSNGNTLWSSDGTAVGTGAFSGVAPLPYGGNVSDLTVAGDRLYFTADDGVHGSELWSTDGTAAGTVMVADIDPGPAGSDPTALSGAPDGTLLFAADDQTHGDELWHTVPGAPPQATLEAAVMPVDGAATIAIPVTYTSARGIDPATVRSAAAVSLTAPGGVILSATSAVADAGADPTRRTVTYTFAAPGGRLTAADNGTYAVSVDPVVTDAAGIVVAGGPLGQFTVDVPTGGTALATTVVVAGRAVGGERATARVTIADDSQVPARGTVAIQLLLSTTPGGNPGTATPITTVDVTIRLAFFQRRTVTVPFTYPSGSADGTRFVVAVADADGAVPQVDATAATGVSAAVAYRAATVDLSATAAVVRRRSGKPALVVFRVRNAGSVTATGPLSFTPAVTGGSLASAVTVPTVTRNLSVRAGATASVMVRFAVPAGLVAGAYTLTVGLSPTTSPADDNPTDKSVAVALTVL